MDGKNILVVEDEAKMREFIGLYLKKEGYNVIEASDGKMALDQFNANKIDLVLLDVMMPKMDGFQTCKAVRKQSKVPIIILTAVEEENDQIKGYEIGADDYVTKPFKVKVLMAKIKRYFEKIERENNKSLYTFEGFKIDLVGKTVCIDKQFIKLAPKEFDLLEYLVINKGIALTRDQILDNVWGFDFEGENRVVDNHIKKVRSKLQKYSKFIETVVSVGYKFEGDNDVK